MSLYFALETVENNKNMKSIKLQGDMSIFLDFIQVFVYTTNNHFICLWLRPSRCIITINLP